MQDLRCIGRYLDLESAKLLAIALVSSRLDYCNSLLTIIADTDLSKLHLFRTDCSTLWRRRLHLLQSIDQSNFHSVNIPSESRLSVQHKVEETAPYYQQAMFHCFVPFISHQLSWAYCSRSVCWPKKLFMKKQAVFLHSMLVSSLSSRSLRWQKGITPLVPRFRTKKRARAFNPLSLKPPPAIYAFSYLSCYLQELSQDTSRCRDLFRKQTSTPDDLLMLWNSFIDFGIEHIFGCRASEPGYTADIGAWSIELLPRWVTARPDLKHTFFKGHLSAKN